MATAAPTSGWSATLPLQAGSVYTYTVTPAAGGSVLLQGSADNTNWTNFYNSPQTTNTSGTVPSSFLYVRGMSFGAAGSFDIVAVPQTLATPDPTATRNARLARIAAQAAGPVIAPAAWAATTAYTKYQARRLSTGQILVCAVAGTSGAAEPTGFIDGRPITDGTVTWYCTAWNKTASDPGAPTVTLQASAAAAGLTLVDFTPAPNNSAVPGTASGRGARITNPNQTFLGQYTLAIGTNLASGNVTAFATADGRSASYAYSTSLWAVEAVVVDSKFGIVSHNGSAPMYIEVDGQPLQADVTQTTGTSGQCTTVDYAGVVKKRTVRIVGFAAGPLVQGIALTAQGYLDTPSTPTDTMLVLGDSISLTQTVDLGEPHAGHMSFWLERYLGLDQLILAGIGGSGYVSANANTFTIPQVLSNVENQSLFAAYNPTHILHQGGYNDRAGSRAPAMAAALATWQATRQMFPTAKITVTDGFPAASGPDANALSWASDIRAQFLAWGDSNSRFVQAVSTSASTSWMSGTGLISGVLSAGNSSVFSGDANHPGPAGSRYLARRMADAIIAAWAGNY